MMVNAATESGASGGGGGGGGTGAANNGGGVADGVGGEEKGKCKLCSATIRAPTFYNLKIEV